MYTGGKMRDDYFWIGQFTCSEKIEVRPNYDADKRRINTFIVHIVILTTSFLNVFRMEKKNIFIVGLPREYETKLFYLCKQNSVFWLFWGWIARKNDFKNEKGV